MLSSLNYLFAIGTIFAFLDAWNIGANDVANSWATSVGSRSVSLIQAMTLGGILEFAGALGVGARVADTIRTKVIDTAAFSKNPSLLMLAMTCAVVASATWLSIATRIGLPVSTTHSIMGGVIGVGVATLGVNGVLWAPGGAGVAVINGGVIQVFLAWIIAPGLSAIFGAALFLTTKYFVMLRSNPVRNALYAIPVYFAIASGAIAMLLIWKGGGYTVDLTEEQIPIVVVCTGIGFGILTAIFFNPWVYRIVVKGDWELKWYHMFLGPLLLKRPDPPAPEAGQNRIRNFYEGHLTAEELEARRNGSAAPRSDVEATAGGDSKVVDASVSGELTPRDSHSETEKEPAHKPIVGPRPEGPWYSGAVIFWAFKFAFFRGVDVDVIGSQSKADMLSGDIEATHAAAAHYDNKAEFMYTFVQVMTASAASFTHGANDVANAIGPYATIFQIWESGALPAKGKSDVPLWILAFGGIGITIGLWTYGYRIMRNLGNKLTLHSPSRGFAMEMGSTLTIVMATRLKLPISTTQCITGAVVGVGLCNGDWRALNWRMIAWIYGGWILTLPVAGTLAGCLMGIIINAPRWGVSVTN